jgi:hypothetical protein
MQSCWFPIIHLFVIKEGMTLGGGVQGYDNLIVNYAQG